MFFSRPLIIGVIQVVLIFRSVVSLIGLSELSELFFFHAWNSYFNVVLERLR